MFNSTNKEENDQSDLPSSLRLALTVSFVAIIEEFLALLSVLDSIEEYKMEVENEKKVQEELDGKFKEMQQQIDELTKEVNRLKYRRGGF
ncbi:hypothetical protein EKG37_01830 [Robertmurraya yapensis]|uniref:Uncharacterized protein n=1 Tax=Bacillus yapensis TaxID=2492960 RepID=A0A3S0K5Z1_9BACI|nr:hypothetical protein [Bacillus yapensis]RTR36320.1 hypothetical protein EKG37_01830 [Bacillus yapensis]TKT05823.1 hypothetical protein FAR12_01830 [Bacillus yapensis]